MNGQKNVSKTQKYQTKKLDVDAIQMSPIDPNVADKDLEEEVRALVRWVEERGGVIRDYDYNYFSFFNEDDPEDRWVVTYGRWIVQDEVGLIVLKDKEFKRFFTPKQMINIHINQGVGGSKDPHMPSGVSPAMMAKIQQSQIQGNYLQ